MRQFILTALMMTVNNYNTNNMKKFHPYNDLTGKSSICAQLNTTKWFLGIQLIIVLILFTFSISLAQNSNIFQVSDNRSEVISVLSTDSNIDVEHFMRLRYDLQPTIFIENNSIANISEEGISVVRLDDMSSNEILKNDIPGFHTSELLFISIKKASDLQQQIDVQTLTNFDRLKYIFILSYISVSDEDIHNLLINADASISIIYSLATEN
ncbi:hypothetical protein SAMN05444285_1722 [Draconibacterium orientale]|uniref:Uncharacterized protein n=2 Tax=Draconibacterium orientale TaxID=1168034 RepID=X5DN69_9BACT|nr:hypothetical protein FH5T_14295 [Draconibacterium orientale]SEU16837.1 hypothetical protein SAMN05444285_1722 [Draconibacterium orientale]